MNDAALSLQTEGLSFNYGKNVALDDVSIAVPEGRFVALLGANGAGKTTLFSLITGLYSARSGQVKITGFDLRRQTLKALANIGVVFQRSTLDLDLSVKQNLHYAAALQGIKKQAAKSAISQAISRHGLDGLDKRKIHELSGGQRRRVELARALLHQPKLVLLDEPTVGLDMQSRVEFVAHVKNLCTEAGTGVLWATHLMDEVSDDNQVYILNKGRIVESGEVPALKQKHGAENVAQLFGMLLDSTVQAASNSKHREN